MLRYIIISFIPIVLATDTYRVATRSGTYEGVVLESETDNNLIPPVIGFLGVHYGRDTKLTGLLSFPKPVLPFEGIRVADKLAKSCYGNVDHFFPGFRGSERWNPPTEMSTDCLNMNIWVPEPVNQLYTEKYPVLVWIYGGGFKSGSPSLDLYDGRILASKMRVIVIGINYRLGPFGFTAFDFSKQPEITGNVGLHDQTLALQWIRNNIAGFGGDPSKITLFGESAGAVSVNYHQLKNGHLLHGVIMQSGTLLCPWATEKRRKIWDLYKKMSEKLGCYDRMDPNRNSTKLLDCLNSKDPASIMEAAKEAEKTMARFMSVGQGPVHERYSSDPLTIPDRLYKNFAPNIPVLMGVNRDEGSFALPYWFSEYFEFDPNDPEKVPKTVDRRGLHEMVEKMFASFSVADRHKLKFEYQKTPGTNVPRSKREAVIAMISDFFFICPSLRTAEILRRQGKTVYEYLYSHDSSGNPWPDWMGVLHGEEIPSVFGYPFRAGGEENYDQTDKRVSERMMEYWAAFARNGDPTTEHYRWVPYGINNITGGGEVYSNSIPNHCHFFRGLDKKKLCKLAPYNWLCDHKITVPRKQQPLPSPPSLPLRKTTIATASTTPDTTATTTLRTTKSTTASTSAGPARKRDLPVKTTVLTTNQSPLPTTTTASEPSPTAILSSQSTTSVTESLKVSSREKVEIQKEDSKVTTDSRLYVANDLAKIRAGDNFTEKNESETTELFNSTTFRFSATLSDSNNASEMQSDSGESSDVNSAPEAEPSKKESDTKNVKSWTDSYVVKSAGRFSVSSLLLWSNLLTFQFVFINFRVF